MKETDKILAEILEKGLSVATKTGDFVIEQSPDIIQQFIYWKIAEYSLSVILSLISMIIAYYIWKNVLKSFDYDQFDITLGILGWIVIIGLGIFSILAFSDIYNLIKIIVAPKIFLIEYTIELLK